MITMEEHVRLAIITALNFLTLLSGLFSAACFSLTLVNLQDKCPLFISSVKSNGSSIPNVMPGQKAACGYITTIAFLSAFLGFVIAFHGGYATISAKYKLGFQRFLRSTRRIHIWLTFSVIMLLLHFIAAAVFSIGFSQTCNVLIENIKEDSCRKSFWHLFTNDPSSTYGNRIFTALLVTQGSMWCAFLTWLLSCVALVLHMRWHKKSHMVTLNDDYSDVREITSTA